MTYCLNCQAETTLNFSFKGTAKRVVPFFIVLKENRNKLIWCDKKRKSLAKLSIFAYFYIAN